MKSSLQPPLDAWQKRYDRLQEKSHALFLDLLRARMPGVSRDGLFIYMEAQHNALAGQRARVAIARQGEVVGRSFVYASIPHACQTRNLQGH